MQSRQHSAGRALHDPGDLPVAEALEAGDVYSHAEVIGKLHSASVTLTSGMWSTARSSAERMPSAVCDSTRASCQPSIRAVLTGLALPVAAAADERVRQGASEIVVDARGNIYINGADFDFVGGGAPEPGYIKLVTPDGQLRQVAGDIASPTAWSSPRTT